MLLTSQLRLSKSMQFLEVLAAYVPLNHADKDTNSTKSVLFFQSGFSFAKIAAVTTK